MISNFHKLKKLLLPGRTRYLTIFSRAISSKLLGPVNLEMDSLDIAKVRQYTGSDFKGDMSRGKLYIYTVQIIDIYR